MSTTLQDVINAACLIIGGTQPDSKQPYLYSGYTVGDGTGVAGIHNAYSAPPLTIQDAPTALILPGTFTVGEAPMADVLTQGREFNTDHLRLLVLVRDNDPLSQYPNLVPFRDSIPAALRAHTQLNPTASPGLNILTAWITAGKAGIFEWGGTSYIGWDFTLTIQRFIPATYTA